MSLRPCCARFAISLSWSSSALRPSIVRMPLRARITNPEFLSAGQKASMSTSASTDPLAPTALPTDDPDDVQFSSLFGVRSIELNRPFKLNSLNGSMARKIIPRLREWEKSQLANIILMSGAGTKAFCAGGDVAELAAQNSTREGQRKSSDYFALEYMLDYQIATLSKPYIAVMDGITMGGGVGLSVHAPIRIATERTVFAMPETTIGFFPDVGGSFFLPRLDGEIGTYLALTSERLYGVQTLHAGIATHYLDSSVLGALTARLSELEFRDSASLPERLRVIDDTLAEYSTTLPPPDPSHPHGSLTSSLRTAIDTCFSQNSIPAILSSLKDLSTSNSDPLSSWASSTLQSLQTRSPTSLKVSLAQLRRGRTLNIAEAFRMEYTMATHFMRHPDFVEGVTARLVSKPRRNPVWKPAKLKEVTDESVKGFFTPLKGAPDLSLAEPYQPAGMAASGKGSGVQGDYLESPYSWLGMPPERYVTGVIAQEARFRREVVRAVLERWGDRVGVREKVEDVLERRTVVDGEGMCSLT